MQGASLPLPGGAPESANKKGIAVFRASGFAFSDGPTESPAPVGAQRAPPVTQVAKITWQVAVAVLVVAAGLLTRLEEVLNDMSIQTAVTAAVKAFFDFSVTSCLRFCLWLKQV